MLNIKGSHTGSVVPLFILLMVLKNTPHLKENYCHNWRIVRKKSRYSHSKYLTARVIHVSVGVFVLYRKQSQLSSAL